MRTVAVLTLLVTIIGVSIAGAAYWWPRGDNGGTVPETAPTIATATSVDLFDPALQRLPEDRAGILPALCGESYRSSRDDALACSAAQLYLDPCFPVARSMAACVDPALAEPLWVRVAELIPAATPKVTDTMADATDGLPFALRLEDGTHCYWELTPPQRAVREAGEAVYECGHPEYLIGDPEAFLSGEDRSGISIEFPDDGFGRAVELDRSRNRWTVLYAPDGDGSYSATSVRVVYY